MSDAAIERCLRHVEALSAHDIGEVLDDVELRRKKTKIFYAVDPFEIVDYCFPIEPNSARRAPHVSTEQLAHDQAALYELFTCSQSPILVLPAYRPELEGIEVFVRHMLDRAHGLSRELFDLLSSDLGDAPDAVDEKRLDALEENFSLILALNLGLLSLGTRRFTDLLSGPVSPAAPRQFSKLEGDKDRFLWPELRPTVLSSIALRCLEQTSAATRIGGASSRTDRETRNNLRDAEAIDYVVTLNRELLKQYEDARLRDHILVLYVSSAKRSHRIFRDRQVQERLPIIEGKPFSVWRTRDQIYALAAAGGLGRLSPAKLQAAKRRLLAVKDLLNGLSAMPRVGSAGSVEKCARCALEGGTDRTCSSFTRCAGMRRLADSLERRSSHVANLSFVETADRFQVLASQLERRAEKREEGESRAALMSEWRSVLQWTANSPIARGLAVERRLLLQRLVLVKASFAPWYGALNERAPGSAWQRVDFVTTGDQALPIWFEVSGDEAEILRCVQTAAFNNTWRRRSISATALSDAARKFLEREVGAGRFDRPHELTRCLLFMASDDTQGNRLAANHAAAMRRFLWKDDADFLYVQIWAEFRSGRANQAVRLAKEGIEAWPRDWRFALGRALARYQAWRQTGMNTPIGWNSLRRDLVAAKDLLVRDTHLEAGSRARIYAVILNDLAYLQAIEGRARRSARDRDRLAAGARRDLEELKKYKSGRSEDWAVQYPEYLHTESTVEILEASILSDKTDYLSALRKLQFARIAVDSALRVLDKPTFLETKAEIDEAIGRISALGNVTK